MKLSRLHGRKINDYLRRRGRMFRGNALLIRYLPGTPKGTSRPGIYAGTSASVKLEKSAVKRNRMRRRCREALRLAVRERAELPSVQLLITPRSSSLSCEFGDLQKDISRFLSML